MLVNFNFVKIFLDISLGIRIRCAICKNFDLCCDCFIVGVETFTHKSSHDYTVIDEVKQPIFTKTWTGDEVRKSFFLTIGNLSS